MQKYFFHIRQDGVLTEDPDGSEFATLNEAHDYAVSSAREILANKVKSGKIIDGDRLEVVRPDGSLALTVPLKSALKLD